MDLAVLLFTVHWFTAKIFEFINRVYVVVIHEIWKHCLPLHTSNYLNHNKKNTGFEMAMPLNRLYTIFPLHFGQQLHAVSADGVQKLYFGSWNICSVPTHTDVHLHRTLVE